jgi:multiple sugar transport system ATP-binding protein
MNFLDATLIAAADGLAVRLGDRTLLALPPQRAERLVAHRDRPVALGLRPEHLSRAGAQLRPGSVGITALIDLVQPTGARTYATFKLGGVACVAELQAHDVSAPGERVELALDMNRAVLIDPQTEKVI